MFKKPRYRRKPKPQSTHTQQTEEKSTVQAKSAATQPPRHDPLEDLPDARVIGGELFCPAADCGAIYIGPRQTEVIACSGKLKKGNSTCTRSFRIPERFRQKTTAGKFFAKIDEEGFGYCTNQDCRDRKKEQYFGLTDTAECKYCGEIMILQRS